MRLLNDNTKEKRLTKKNGQQTHTSHEERERETDAEKGIVHLYNGRVNGDPDKDT